MEIDLIKGGGLIDFYIDRRRYEKLKKPFSKKRLVYKTLMEILKSLRLEIHNGIEFRDISITLNNFWTNEPVIINDLNYSANNPLPLKEDVVTFRIFLIDIIGIVVKESKPSDYFFNIRKNNFYLAITNIQII